MRRFQIVRLNLLRINIFSVRKHDHFFSAARDEQVTARIEVSQIARVEPAIAQNRRRGIWTIPVALHHNRPAQRNLPCCRRALFHRFRIDDLRFHCGKRRPDGPNHNLPRTVDKCAACCFRQAVSVQHVDPERIKIACNCRIKARTSRNQIAHVLAKRIVNLSKKKFAGVDPDSSQPAIDFH